MTSQRQIEANRLNAQGSTGPRTPDGKERVASNALKHGLTGKRVVLPNENPEEFDTFRSALWEELGPRGALEEVLAEEIVADVWRLRRVPILEATVHARDEQELIVRAMISEIAQIKAAADRDSELFERIQKRELTPAERKALDKAQAKLGEAQAKLEEPTFRVTRALERHAGELERLWRRGRHLDDQCLERCTSSSGCRRCGPESRSPLPRFWTSTLTSGIATPAHRNHDDRFMQIFKTNPFS